MACRSASAGGFKVGFAEDGYLVVPGFLDAGTCAALIKRAEEIAAEQAPGGPRSVFTTVEQDRSSDEWFLESGDQVRCFFEPEAFAADGSFARPPAEVLNKIGRGSFAAHNTADAQGSSVGSDGLAARTLAFRVYFNILS